jgi:hypothetical protein
MQLFGLVDRKSLRHGPLVIILKRRVSFDIEQLDRRAARRRAKLANDTKTRSR